MTILFAQNHTGNTPLITNHLQNDGFIVIFLDKNVDTLQQAQMQHADIIITDLLSAKATFSLISLVRNKCKRKIPILILCDAGQENLLQEALDLGADDYFCQPEKSEKLKELSLRINLLPPSRLKAAV